MHSQSAQKRYMVGSKRRCFSCLRLCLLTLVTAIATNVYAQSVNLGSFTDTVYLTNGDRVTGNIKELDRGKLRVNTLTMDTIYLNWSDVSTIESTKFLVVTQTDGRRANGQLQKSAHKANIAMIQTSGILEVPTTSVASIRPLRINASFWARLEGEASAGIDYKKGSDVLTVNVSSKVRLREEKYEIGVSFDWNETTKSVENKTSRANLTGNYTRFRPNRWFWQGVSTLETSEELGLDLRTLVGGSIGRYLYQTDRMRFQVNAGLAATNENRSGASDQLSLEAMFRSSWDIFVFSIPKTRLTSSWNVFPGLTQSGRVRSNLDVTLRNELIRDLYWDVRVYATFDNQPPGDASESDYGVVTSLGYTF